MIALADPEATEAFGLDLARLIRPGDVVALYGSLGAGKTTLVRGMLRGLGYQGEVASPTFPIVIAYHPPETSLPIWHVDLYRIEHHEELEELGLEDARSDGVLLIEWPERLPTLWADTLRLRLEQPDAGGRALTADVPQAWGTRWPP